MTEKKYHIKTTCPGCGKKHQLALTASAIKALPQGQSPKALTQCTDCNEHYHCEINAHTCAEWDTYCKEEHPVP